MHVVSSYTMNITFGAPDATDEAIAPAISLSGGSLLALTADQIVMDPHAVLGPVDPQIGDMPAASIVKLLELKPAHQISDEMLVLTDIAQKARRQVAAFVDHVLLKHLPRDRAAALAITWLVSRSITRPLRSLTKATRPPGSGQGPRFSTP